jgi:ribosomal protein L33
MSRYEKGSKIITLKSPTSQADTYQEQKNNTQKLEINKFKNKLRDLDFK